MGIVDDASSSSTGLEGSGIVTRVGSNAQHLKPEDRVMFISNGGSFTTSLLTSQKLCVKIPDNLTLEEASTMPCVFSTVVHCLVNLVKLEKEQVSGHKHNIEYNNADNFEQLDNLDPFGSRWCGTSSHTSLSEHWREGLYFFNVSLDRLGWSFK